MSDVFVFTAAMLPCCRSLQSWDMAIQWCSTLYMGAEKHTQKCMAHTLLFLYPQESTGSLPPFLPHLLEPLVTPCRIHLLHPQLIQALAAADTLELPSSSCRTGASTWRYGDVLPYMSHDNMLHVTWCCISSAPHVILQNHTPACAIDDDAQSSHTQCELS